MTSVIKEERPVGAIAPGDRAQVRTSHKGEMLTQQERLEALAEMASSISHDLNNSLTPIIGFSDYLLEGGPSLPDEYRKCIQGIRNAAGDIASMVEQMRYFYRRRDLNERLEVIELNTLIRELLKSPHATPGLQFDRQNDRVQVQTHLGKNLPAVHDHASELRQAVLHLIANGLEAMPNGGTLSITTRLLHATSADPGTERILLEVSDTGVGMDALTRLRCLEPFFSTKGPRRRGLGLAAVYGAVRRHGGRIDIQSEPGRGTTVRVVFNPRTELNRE